MNMFMQHCHTFWKNCIPLNDLKLHVHYDTNWHEILLLSNEWLRRYLFWNSSGKGPKLITGRKHRGSHKRPRIQNFQHLGFLRMKPHFSHLDRDNKRKRDSVKQEDGSDEDELPANKAQQVTVRFANRGGDSERWAKAKEASFRTLMAMDAQEPWVECDWHGKSSELSDVRFYSHFFMHELLTTYLTSLRQSLCMH